MYIKYCLIYIVLYSLTFVLRTYSVLFLQGIRSNMTDACEEHDPCQHGGICISTDSGPICECRNLDYEGIFCEKGTFTNNTILYSKKKKNKIIFGRMICISKPLNTSWLLAIRLIANFIVYGFLTCKSCSS